MPDLAEQVAGFAAKLDGLIESCLPDSPGISVTSFSNRFTVKPGDQDTEKRGGVPLSVNGVVLANLRFTYLCKLDAGNEFLTVERSKVWIVAAVDNTPIFRYEYLSDADRVPQSHIQVHGQRGALSHLLSKAGHASPHDMAALHLPTGGARFRPNLEDVIQFLIVDCKFDSLDTGREVVEQERAQYRTNQARSVVRAMADVAADQLAKMGYAVTPPASGHPQRDSRAQHAW